MAHLDVYPMPAKGGRGYVVDVQATLLEHLGTRAVVPLVPQAAATPPIKELNPVFTIAGEPHVMVTHAIATIPTRELRKAVASLQDQHDDITRALDILLTGY